MPQRLGRYETIRQIASGGMATVFLGRVLGEGGFERLVALKVMHQHIAADPDFVAMFLDEARLAARIRHPNVVATIDIQKSDERMFLVMEYIEGAALSVVRRHLRKQRRVIPPGVMLRIMLDTLDGLHAAHELTDDDGQPLNLVHRDVSPQNVLIGKDGVTRITDFGVARAEARLSTTRGGQLKGKLPYMPPEQILSQPTDRRADVYAAGVVLWELLVGRRLFSATNEGAMVHDIISGDLVPPHEQRPDTPQAISEVCMRAISRDPADRYDSAAKFADALEDAALEDEILPARRRKVGQFLDAVRTELPSDHPQISPLTPASMSSTRSERSISSNDASAATPISMAPSSLPLSTPNTRTEAVLESVPSSVQGKRSWRALVAVAAVLTGGALAVLNWYHSGENRADDAATNSSAVVPPPPAANPDETGTEQAANATPHHLDPSAQASASTMPDAATSAPTASSTAAAASTGVSPQASPHTTARPTYQAPPPNNRVPTPSTAQPSATSYRPIGL